MKKRLLTTIAGAALTAGCGLALAQTMESSPGGAKGAQGSSQRQPGGAAHERQPGAMQGQAQGRSGATQSPAEGPSGAIEEQEHRSGQPGAMQGQERGRSGAVEKIAHRPSQSGATQGTAQERSGAIKDKEHRSAQSGMQSPAKGRSGAMEDKEHRSGQSGAVQGSSRQRSSAGSTALSSDQRTRLSETIASGNVHRTDHVNFSLSVGTHVPNNVTFYDVPERIAYIVPQYRDFRYIAVRDDFAIIDPGTREIVALVPMHGSLQGQVGRSVGSTTLSADQRTRLHTVITGGDIRRIDNADFALSVGTRVPNTVTFYDLPETMVEIIPEYRGYDYIVVRDELVIIDPETLEIVAVLPA